jgi:outer membrane protein assembly factor BamD (BamD/ComL family)
MKKAFLFFSFFACLFVFSANAYAQKNIDVKVDRDPILEADAMHNLDVARQAFKLKKAYKAVLLRTEVIIAAYPDFSRIEEVLYLSGMSSYYLAEGKGKQKAEPRNEEERAKYAPEKLRDDAGAYLTQLLKQFPNTKYKEEAEKTLKLLESKRS